MVKHYCGSTMEQAEYEMPFDGVPGNDDVDLSRLAALAVAPATADCTSIIVGSQTQRWFLTLDAIADALDSSEFDDACTLLRTAQQRDPAAVGRLIHQSQANRWSQLCLENATGVADDDRAGVDVDYLYALAAVAAHRAGAGTFSVAVSVRNGAIVLPGLGRITVASTSFDSATIRSDGERLEVHIGDEVFVVPSGPDQRDDDEWQPLRVLELTHDGRLLRVVLDDLDRYRFSSGDVDRVLTSGRLTATQVEHWRDRLAQAWRLLVDFQPEYAEHVASMVHALVVVDAPFDHYVSPSAAFGSVMVPSRQSAMWLAFTLLDAAQQATAQSIHHLQPLYKTTFRDPHYLAPGLDHPATLAMLVRSTFPHVADAAFWDVQRRTQTEEHCRIDAAVAFERCSSRVTHLCDVLELSGDITIWGSQLLADLAGEVVRQRQSFAPSSDDVRLLARQDELDFRLSWRLRNIQPHERHVKILANAWVASASCPRLQDFALHIRDGQGLVRHRGRAALGIDRLASDADFRSVREDMDLLRNTVPNATKADYLLVAGDIDFAADAFVEEIMLDPDDAEPWAGLALVAALRGSNTVVFSRFPEILYAVHREIRLTYQRTVDPQELALWMTPFITYLDDTGCLVS